MSVLETPGYEKQGDVGYFTRSFQIENVEGDWTVVLADAPGEAVVANNVLSVVAGNKNARRWRFTVGSVSSLPPARAS